MVHVGSIERELGAGLLGVHDVAKGVLFEVGLGLESFFALGAAQYLEGVSLVGDLDVRMKVTPLRETAVALRARMVLALIMHTRAVRLKVKALHKGRRAPRLVALEGAPPLVDCAVMSQQVLDRKTTQHNRLEYIYET